MQPTSEAASPTNETETPPSAIPPTELPPGQTSDNASKPAEQSPFRYADDASVPDYARGKTAEEVLALTQRLYNAAMQSPSQPVQAAPQTPQTPAPNMNQNATPAPPDPQLMYSEPALYQSQMLAYQQAVANAQMQSFAAPMLRQQASFARSEASRNAKLAPIFAKYSGEIDLQMANVPVENRSQEAWEMAAKIVAGEHLDELAQARAETLAARPDFGTISGAEGVANGASRTPADPITEMFRNDDPAVAKFRSVGKSAADIIAHAANMGHTPEAYAEMLKRNTSITHYEHGTPKTQIEAAHATGRTA